MAKRFLRARDASAFIEPRRLRPRLLIAAWLGSLLLVAVTVGCVTYRWSGDHDAAPRTSVQTATPGRGADEVADSRPAKPDRPAAAETASEEADAQAPKHASESAPAPQPAAEPAAPAPRYVLAGPVGLVALPTHGAGTVTREVARWCGELGARVAGVSRQECLDGGFEDSGHRSVNGRPLVMTGVRATSPPAAGRVLLISATHGDEPSSVGTVFQWLHMMREHGTPYTWHIVPTLNPDGVLDTPATRVNAHGVDLNRNLPTTGWAKESRDYWRRVGFEKRRFPGENPGSEPENQWLAREIDAFRPDLIISLHAPYGVLDYDGDFPAPQQLGRLHLHRLGVYPGSLGNFASRMQGIPVITVELEDALDPPSHTEAAHMWRDLNHWMDRYFRSVRQARSQVDKDAG